jgi:hypothetical protein
MWFADKEKGAMIRAFFLAGHPGEATLACSAVTQTRRKTRLVRQAAVIQGVRFRLRRKAGNHRR